MNYRASFVVAALLAAAPAAAQQDASARDRAHALDEAKRLAGAGEIDAARRITDSLARSTVSDASDFGDLLFARATYAPSVLDAALDYERIVSELSPSPVARASLIRLAQRALVLSQPAKALEYLQRVLRDYSDDASVAEAQYWRAVALLDAHDSVAACSANREARVHAQATQVRLRAAIETQRVASCGPSLIADSGTRGDSATKAAITTARAFAVQVAAFGTRADADELAGRLKARGFDAHVDGTTKPFRVRIGHYATYAEAAKAMRELKSRKISGFVSESDE